MPYWLSGEEHCACIIFCAYLHIVLCFFCAFWLVLVYKANSVSSYYQYVGILNKEFLSLYFFIPKMYTQAHGFSFWRVVAWQGLFSRLHLPVHRFLQVFPLVPARLSLVALHAL